MYTVYYVLQVKVVSDWSVYVEIDVLEFQFMFVIK